MTFVPCEPGEFIYQIDLLPGTGLRADGFEGYPQGAELGVKGRAARLGDKVLLFLPGARLRADQGDPPLVTEQKLFLRVPP